jgi:four helix bundle protein
MVDGRRSKRRNVQRFTKIEVWELGHRLSLDVYRLTRSFPREELYGLTSQIRRASTSVPINIAEGSKRAGNRDYARFLNIAESSLAETEYELMLARDLGYAKAEDVDPLLVSVSVLARKLHALRLKVEGNGK